MCLNFFKKRYWSPYYSGVLIGLLQIPIFLLLHASIGSSHSFHGIACSILALFDSTNSSCIVNQCFPLMKNWWQLAFVVGILIGAYISSALSHSRKQSFSPMWTKAANITSFFKRVVMAFCGGFIMLLGARIADGCTSGNGLSGIVLLSIGSMIVIAAMFIGGIIFVQLYKKI